MPYLPRGFIWRQVLPLLLVAIILLTIILTFRGGGTPISSEDNSAESHKWRSRVIESDVSELESDVKGLKKYPEAPLFGGQNQSDSSAADAKFLLDKLPEKTQTPTRLISDQNHSDFSPVVADSNNTLQNNTWMLRQAKLRRHIRDTCNGMQPFSALNKWQRQWVLRHLIVDDKYQLLYCYTPKVACANWKRVFNTLYGDAPDTDSIVKVDHTSMKLLATYSEEGIRYRLQNYFKFMFVRHPLDRLLSAYRNKFGQHFEDFERIYGIYIVKHFRPNPPAHPKGNDVTFSEFMDYVSLMEPQKLNEHWSRYTDLCQPCHVKYDFIGYFENFHDDVNLALDIMKLNKFLSYPKKQAFYHPINEEERNAFFAQVSNKTLERLIKQQLAMDFQLFGYPTDRIGGPIF